MEPQVGEVHTCSRCGDTVVTNRSTPPGWIISVTWTSPDTDLKRREDLKRSEICPKHRDDMDREYLVARGKYLEREVEEHNAQIKALGGGHA